MGKGLFGIIKGHGMNEISKILFGKHQGKQLKDIPDSYWTWLLKQDWFMKSTFSYNVELKKWINENKK